MLRRVAFVRVAQRVGISLAEIGSALATLPPRAAAPSREDWARRLEPVQRRRVVHQDAAARVVAGGPRKQQVVQRHVLRHRVAPRVRPVAGP
ncbi:hypothetical protein DBV14_25250 [Variovorax sp. KBW07]|nr:hypothetical protein DBV14_25250 [Variovorax sp. KBW07]